jgi:hypothetical protein
MSRAALTARMGLIVAIALIGMTGPAAAISLGALTAGASLSSDDGSVVFSDFSVAFLAGIHEDRNALLNLDLSLVDVQLISLGDRRILSFEGGLEVHSGVLGQMWIDYAVATDNGFEIIGADISLKAETLTTFTSVSVVESISGGAFASLHASERFDGTGTPSASNVFALPARNLTVSNEVFLDGGFGGTTRVASLQQSFSVAGSASPVPEPGASLLFGVGVLISATRLRRRPAV